MCWIDDTWVCGVLAAARSVAHLRDTAPCAAPQQHRVMVRSLQQACSYSAGTRSARNVGAWPRTINTGTDRAGVSESTTFANVAGESIS